MRVDRGLPFVCRTLTPLYYTSVYREFTPAQALRYNQITGMHFNEVICFFERTFAEQVLTTLARTPARNLSGDLSDSVLRFLEEERRHTEMFRELNLRSAPEWYGDGPHRIIRLSPWARRCIEWLARRPTASPAMVILMLLMEERSIEIARRILKAGVGEIEPHYRAVHEAHVRDEARHVQVDLRLLGVLYERRDKAFRSVNAAFFRFMVTEFFLAPDRSTWRVVEILLREHPELEALRPRIRRELRGLGSDPEYHRMVYSRDSCPQAFSMFDRFPEFHPLQRGLLSYHPEGGRR